ncbi:MAG: hypothetical protein SNJ75_06895 [Gemmataceae bacterium]
MSDEPTMIDEISTEAPPAKAPEKAKKSGNKREMFEASINALGAGAKPLEMQEWIREHYGKTLKTSLLSTYKSSWLREQGTSARGQRKTGIGRRDRSPGASKSLINRPAKPSLKQGEQDATINDIRVLREMLSRVGEAQVREMLDLLGVR